MNLKERYGYLYKGLVNDWHPDWDNCHEDKDGNVICGICGKRVVEHISPTLAKMSLYGNGMIAHVCDCYEAMVGEEQRKQENEEKRSKIAKLKSESLLSNKYDNARFQYFDMNVNTTVQNARLRAEKYCTSAKICLDKAFGIMFQGNRGLGKTHIMACMANELMDNLYTVYFTSLADLLSKRRSNTITEEEMLQKVTDCDFLFLDDIGQESCTSDWASSMVYNIINARYNAHKPVIVSSNANFTQLMAMGMRSCITDRLSEMCTVRLTLEGTSYREHERKRKEMTVPF